MPKSKRRQRLAEKKRVKKHSDEAQSRSQVRDKFAQSMKRPIRKVADECGISKTIASDARKAMIAKDKEKSYALLNPNKSRPGRQRVLSQDEEKLIAKGMMQHASYGISWSDGDAAGMMGRISSDGRSRACKSEAPSSDALRSFRARHPELSRRRAQAKELAKLQGESYAHVKAHVDALNQIFKGRPGLRSSPEAIISIDEAAADAELGERFRARGSASSRAGGFRAKSSGPGPHAATVIAASAAGRIAPPFLLAAGKSAAPGWADPLSPQRRCVKGILARCSRPDWIAKGAALRASDSGSMEISHMRLMIERAQRLFRRFAPASQPLLLLLDGHSSRRGAAWLCLPASRNIEVAQPPASASHLLQPCDSAISKSRESSLRKARDCPLRAPPGRNFAAKQLKLACASRAYGQISPMGVKAAFGEAGLWAMDMRLLKRLETASHKAREAAQLLKEGGEASMLARGAARPPDAKAMKIIEGLIARGHNSPSSIIQQIAMLLQNQDAASKIIFGGMRSKICAARRRGKDSESQNSKPLPDEQRSGGAPAICLTHRERIQKLKEEEERQQWKKVAHDAVKAARLMRRRQFDQEAKQRKTAKAKKKAQREQKLMEEQQRKQQKKTQKSLTAHLASKRRPEDTMRLTHKKRRIAKATGVSTFSVKNVTNAPSKSSKARRNPTKKSRAKTTSPKYSPTSSSKVKHVCETSQFGENKESTAPRRKCKSLKLRLGGLLRPGEAARAPCTDVSNTTLR